MKYHTTNCITTFQKAKQTWNYIRKLEALEAEALRVEAEEKR
jgi:hypothetical protein